MLGLVPTVLSETQGPLDVCVELLGTLERSISVNLDVENIDTTTQDFINTQETFNFGIRASDEQCFQLVINTDDIIENDERFTIVLSSPMDVVDVISENAPVMIIQDSSMLEVGFSSVRPSVTEGESFLACMRISMGRLSEDFQLPVNIVSLSEGMYNISMP